MRYLRGAALVAVALMAGCGPAAGDDQPLVPTPPASPLSIAPASPFPPGSVPPSQEIPGSPTPRPSPPSASPTGFPETAAVPCNGRPTGDQVIAVVKQVHSLLPSGARVTVADGPVCSGDWQYTVLNVTDREPLQVMTKGPPGALTFVTAGTDVCTTEVLSHAPIALLSRANC